MIVMERKRRKWGSVNNTGKYCKTVTGKLDFNPLNITWYKHHDNQELHGHFSNVYRTSGSVTQVPGQ